MTTTNLPVWDSCETWSRDRITAHQTDRLATQLQRLGRDSAFYRKRFEEVGFDPRGFRSPEDLRALPFTKKTDYVGSVADSPPWGEFLAVPRETVARVHFSSGTTAAPVPQFWTARDLERWADLYARYAHAQGIGPGDIFQCLFTYTWFVGGLGATAGFQRLGATVIPAGSQETERQIRTIAAFGTTVLCGTPSFMVHLGAVAREMGYDPAASTVRAIIVGGEPGGAVPATRRRIEELWGARCCDAYGSLEFQPIGFDCPAQTGPHLAEDFAYAEIVDAVTGEPVEDGTPGVLVLTHLDKEAGPLVRWWTGDVLCRDSRPCACGRTHARLIGGVRGRADDMLVVRGINLFPSAVEEVVRSTAGLTDEYRIVVDSTVRNPDTGLLDAIRLQVEPLSAADAARVAAELAAAVKDRLRVRAVVETVPAGSLPRAQHKAKRLVVEP
ncbi:AMP-binding protein [Azospirillum sp. RWY-5-1]|uniref:AMP-binding protein n=1 Tax=Azospirillum oleiclasticum TaxID=2735135 RepID=A0ABX2TLK4_9PROT|nr:AMP-binding protein [Azospirillum oleiclasticum]NYZ16556.1 AMP-binding protein [Azospirillum oleiclasticum]NYZ23974.1 AMP-binding protein [Azospirillum oleiclasticum]